MNQVRVGVIGVGALGRHHTRLYAENCNADLVGVYDANGEAARNIASEYGTVAFDTVGQLADATDALSVAVPTDKHYEVVRDLFSRGKHVLVEKPIAQGVWEARDLVRMADEAGLVFGVGHVERFNPVLESLADVPGAPRFIQAERLAPFPPPRPALPPRGTEVSVVLDLMIHDIDVILALVDSDIARVDAVGVSLLSPTEDIANAHVLFANGCVANLTASRVSKEPVRKIRVFKSGAYLSLDYQEQRGEIATIQGGRVDRGDVPVREGNALKQELHDFCDCVLATRRKGSVVQPKVSGAAGLRALELAERILHEVRSPATVRV